MNKNNINTIVAKNIRIFRKQQNLSQEKLAELCDLHRTFIGSVERGERNITLNSLAAIANGLGIEVEKLISE